MARNPKSSAKNAELKSSAKDAERNDKTGTLSKSKSSQTRGKTWNKKQSYNRKRRTFSQKAETSGNNTVSSMNVETPIGTQRSFVFPSDSASMAAFGNWVNTPGQENFISPWNWCEDRTAPGTQFTRILINPQGPSKRVANAMVIGICPYFGTVQPRLGGPMGNPIMLAGLNLKQYIDTSFGTNTNYDPQDLMVYLMAVSSVFPVIAELKRDLRLTQTFIQNQWPAFMPKGLFAALGIGDADGNYEQGEGLPYTAEHLRGYVDRLNTLILTFNRLPMPPEIGMFGYNDDLFDYIYMDTPDEQTAQIYVFKNDIIWKYDEESSELGAQLNPSRMSLGSRTIANRLDDLQDQIERITALRTSATAMLQNLFNAYGSKDTVVIPTLDVETMGPVPYTFDEHVLIMIENMNVLNTPNEVHFDNITANSELQQVTGSVCVMIPANVPSRQGDWVKACANIPLQFHKSASEVTTEDIGWALRMKPMLGTWRDYGVMGVLPSCDEYIGFAFATSVNIVRTSDEGIVDTKFWWRSRSSKLWDQVPLSDIMRDFKYAPIDVFGYWSNDDPTQWILTGYTGNRDLEVTYRLEDIRMFWLYMTISVWAANVNRNALGTRTKF